MKVTQRMMEKGLSKNGGYSDTQLRSLGVMTKESGWMDRLLDGEHPEENYLRFLELKDAHLKNKSGNLLSQRHPKLVDDEDFWELRTMMETLSVTHGLSLADLAKYSIRSSRTI